MICGNHSCLSDKGWITIHIDKDWDEPSHCLRRDDHGSKDNQSNQKPNATESDESTAVDSSSVSTEEESNELSSAETSEASNRKEPNEQLEAEQVTEESDPSSQEVNIHQMRETLYLDDSKVGIRYDNYPLSNEVIKALDELGHRIYHGTQQSILDSLTLGRRPLV